MGAAPEMAETVGDRVHLVRKALGPNSRRPLSQDAFAELLTQRGTRRYYGPEISLIESGKKDLTLDDVETIASVDPARRGKAWLAWGEPEEQRTPIASYVIPEGIASALSGELPAPEQPATQPAEHPPEKSAKGKR